MSSSRWQRPSSEGKNEDSVPVVREIDGAYVVSERFMIRLPNEQGGYEVHGLSLEEVFALHRVTGFLLNQAGHFAQPARRRIRSTEVRVIRARS